MAIIAPTLINTSYSPAFNIYEGSLTHEQQHVKEVVGAFNKYRAGFVADVGKISKPTKAEAKTEYDTLFAAFKTNVFNEYWSSGEALAEAAEWAFYHTLYAIYKAVSKVAKVVTARP